MYVQPFYCAAVYIQRVRRSQRPRRRWRGELYAYFLANRLDFGVQINISSPTPRSPPAQVFRFVPRRPAKAHPPEAREINNFCTSKNAGSGEPFWYPDRRSTTIGFSGATCSFIRFYRAFIIRARWSLFSFIFFQ